MIRTRKDLVMLIAMGVLVLFAVYNFLIRPQGADLSSVRDERVAVEQAVSDAERDLVDPVVAPNGQSAEDVSALDKAVPVEPALSALLRQLQQIAAETGMLHGSISPAPLGPNPSGPGGSLQIAIAASGSPAAALAYIDRLRDLERLVVIEQIGVTVQPDGSEQLQISARVFTRQT
jgi:Tfp pilus assembly protein PilO